MQQVIEQPVDFGGLTADMIETSTGKKIKQASAVRWIWQPFKDINLFDNLSSAVQNSLTLRETKRKDGETISNPITVLKRCQPYPLTNCEYLVPRHEAKRYGNFSEELPENDLPSSFEGLSPKGGVPQYVAEQKFAYSSARELSEMYAKEFGLVVLDPLTGVEDSEVVEQIFKMVQPLTFRLNVLVGELTEGANERMRKSTYSKEVKDLAKGVRDLLLKGAEKAIGTARAHHGDFTLEIQSASAGRKGRTRVWPHDIYIAEQLGVEVPRVVKTENNQATNDAILAKLAERELARGDENATLMEALEMERQARIELERKFARFEKEKVA